MLIETSETAAFVSRFDLGGTGPAISIKDSIDIAGHPTQAGSRSLSGTPFAARNAAVVQSFIDAGWHIVGKNSMHELAYGVTGINAWSGTPRNPRWPDRVPGGSSSGSAVAVAAGSVDVAIGTDTGGSIRVPATCCGIIGLKPTFGRISRDGAHPPVTSLDCLGPFARTLDMLERAMQVMDRTYHPLPMPERARVGYLTTSAEAPIDAAVRRYLASTKLDMRDVTLPSFEAAFTAALHVIAAEMYAAFGHLLATGAVGADVHARLMAAGNITPDQVAAGELVRTRFVQEIDAVLEQVDVIALPTLAHDVLTLNEGMDAKKALRSTSLVRQFNLSGHPALSLPLITRDGLPAGLQLVGRRGGDAPLCAVARGLLTAAERS